MRTIYSQAHRLHRVELEYWEGELLPFYESPERAEIILRAVSAAGLGPILPPDDFGLQPILAVHTDDYVRYLQGVFTAWIASGRNPRGVYPDTFAVRHFTYRPSDLALQPGYYSQDVTAVITRGTWEAAYASAQCALTAARQVRDGERAAFALCRPPGHHAHADLSAGYCYLNNAAIAAQWLSLDLPLQSRHPRHRLPPRQRHAGHLLPARRRAVCFVACRSRAALPVLSRLERRARRRRR